MSRLRCANSAPLRLSATSRTTCLPTPYDRLPGPAPHSRSSPLCRPAPAGSFGPGVLLDPCQQRQAAERAEAWPDWEDHGFVFPSRRGTPMEPDNLRRSWYQIRRAAGLATGRFHDLRHTCVTLLLDLGAPPHVVQEIVGHSAIEVTMTIYAHVSLDEKRKALGKLGEALS